MTRTLQRCYSLIVALLVSMSLLMQTSVALASTVGAIQGTVKDASTGAGVAGAMVVAQSPSTKYSATTDAHGYYSIAAAVADTYSLSFAHDGYLTGSQPGVTVFADDVAHVDWSLQKTLKTIANVNVRSSGGAFQPGQTSDTYNVTTAQIQSIQGNQLNTSLKNLIVALPGASYTVGQAPSIRGGRSDNVDYELDGVAMINPYTNENVNNYTMPGIGLCSVQETPGTLDASFGNTGVGTVNSVPCRGSRNAGLTGIMGLGGPSFYHGVALGYGTAALNGRWTEYASFTGANTAPSYGGDLEADSNLNGSYGSVKLITDREFTNNFTMKLGNSNKFELQYFTDIGYHKRSAGYGMGPDYNVITNGPAVGSAQGVVPQCYATCNPAWTDYFGQDEFNGGGVPVYPYWCAQGSAGGAGNPYPVTDTNIRCGDWDGLTTAQFLQMTPLYPGQTSDTQALTNRPYYQEIDNNALQKVALDFTPNSRTDLTLSYSNSSDQHVSDSISLYAFTSGDVWSSTGGHVSTVSLDGKMQMGDSNLLKFGADSYQDRPSFYVVSPLTTLFNPLFNGNFEYNDFIPAGQPCPGSGGNPLPAISWGFNPLYNNNPAYLETSFTNSCGWIYTQAGFNKSFIAPPSSIDTNTVNPNGQAVYLTDTFTPNDRFNAVIGMRVDFRQNHLPAPQVNADCTTNYLPLVWNVYAANVYDSNNNLIHAQNFDQSTGLFNGSPMGPGNCPTASFLPLTSYENSPVIPQPRLQMQYLLSKKDALSFSYGRTFRYANSVFSDASVSSQPYAPYIGLPSHLNTNDLVPFAFTGYQLDCNGGGGCNGNAAGADPTNYYTAHSIATNCGMVSYGIAVPCTSYAEQYYWNGWNGNFGKPLFPLDPITYNNFDLSYARELGAGFEIKATGWTRRAYDLDVASEIINPYSVPHLNADGTKSYGYFGLESNAGIEIAKGFELYLTHNRPWHGFTGFATLDLQNVQQNIDPAGTPAGSARDVTGSVNNEFEGVISSAAAAFGGMYKVNYVSPVTAAFNIQYQTPAGGWRFRTTWFYDDGYPTGQGSHVYQLINGVASNVARSNDCQVAAGSVEFADPTNPGSCLSPNIVASLGTNEGNYANQALTHPNLTAALTIEKDLGPGTVGLTVGNLFNEIYPGPTIPYGIDYGVSTAVLSDAFNSNQGNSFDGSIAYGVNPNYQEVATGVSGPLSGKGTPAGQGPLICSTCPYFHLPDGEGRTYYLYFKVKVGGGKP